MSISAMKQALEALETLNSGDSYKTHNAATALRQAIEFQEMVKKGTKAWADTPDNWVDDLRGGAEKPWVKTYAGGKPNYTAPVHASDMSQERVDETSKRKHEWEELDVNEVIELIHEHITNLTPELTGELYGLVAAIDMRLQEKNHG